VATLQARLVELGVRETRVVAPGSTRRVVVAPVGNEVEAERIRATLRDEGEIALVRPAAGPRLQAWMDHTRPVTFGDELSISFAWSEHDRPVVPTSIELGLGGFGNGDHPSTRMLVQALVQRVSGGERVLDVGCGSGVLGLCALALGAARAVAIDVDASAVEATRRNADLNDMGDRMLATAVPLAEVDGVFDAVVANVGRAAIVELAPGLVRRVAPTGWLGVSGFSPSQCSQVAGYLRPLVEVDRQTSGEWAVLALAH
jgi:ribosomal protein L11 methyltransferase